MRKQYKKTSDKELIKLIRNLDKDEFDIIYNMLKMINKKAGE